jgi:hypothetical protein
MEQTKSSTFLQNKAQLKDLKLAKKKRSIHIYNKRPLPRKGLYRFFNREAHPCYSSQYH